MYCCAFSCRGLHCPICPFMSWPFLSCLVLSCPLLSFSTLTSTILLFPSTSLVLYFPSTLALSYSFTSVLSSLALSYPVLSYSVLSRPVLFCPILPCSVLFILSCSALPPLYQSRPLFCQSQSNLDLHCSFHLVLPPGQILSWLSPV